MMSDFLMLVSRLSAMILTGAGMYMLAELARFGAISGKDGEVWGVGMSAGAIIFLFVLGFLLAFGGAKQ